MDNELHISSLLVQHRHTAMAALEQVVDAVNGLEIALRGECRCVVLCETEDQRALMDHIDALQTIKGVLSVSLVYHHAEFREQMDEPVALPQEVFTWS